LPDPDFSFRPPSPQIPAILQLIRYVAVGGTSALTEILIFHLLSAVFACPLMLSNVAAVATVTALGFFGQKRFTFRNDGPIPLQARLYALQLGGNFLLNNALVFLFSRAMGMPALQAKIVQLGFCLIFNFSFSKYVVFRARSPSGLGGVS
jgi:putative flippase GtrA